jgi:hypothetical protein
MPQGTPQHRKRHRPPPPKPPRKRGRGRPRKEERLRAEAEAAGNTSSSGDCPFYIVTGPPIKNEYQSNSFSKIARRRVAQPHEATLRKYGVSSEQCADVCRRGARKELPKGLRDEMGWE